MHTAVFRGTISIDLTTLHICHPSLGHCELWNHYFPKNYQIKLEMFRSMMDCLFAKCTPCIVSSTKHACNSSIMVIYLSIDFAASFLGSAVD